MPLRLREALALPALFGLLLGARDASADAPKDPWPFAAVPLQTFDDRSGLPQNTVRALAFDSHERLWVGTQDGVAVYDGRGFSLVPLPPEAHSVDSIRIDESDTVFLAMADAGLLIVKDDALTVTDTHAGLPDNEVYVSLGSRADDGSEELWVGTNAGLARRVGTGPFKVFTKADGLLSSAITTLAETREANGARVLWAGMPKGLTRLDGEAWVPFATPGLKGRVTSLVADGAALWVGTLSGVCRLERGVCTQLWDEAHELPSPEVDCLLPWTGPDGEPGVGVGTRHGGLVRLPSGDDPFVLDVAHGLPGDIVTSLARTRVDQGGGSHPGRTLFVGLNSRGLAQVELGRWRSFGTSSGLPSPSVYSVLESNDLSGVSTYWAGTLGGLARFDGSLAKPRWVSAGVTDKPVLSLLQSRTDGAIWVSSDGGVARIKDSVTTWWRAKDGLPGPANLGLLESQSDQGVRRLWIANQEGMSLLEGDKITKTWRQADGLPSDIVIGFAETVKRGARGDEKTLWASTLNGIASIDEETLTMRAFPVSDAPGANLVLSLFAERDDLGHTVLWAGTKAGPFRALLGDGKPAFSPLPLAVTSRFPNLVVNQLQRDHEGRLYVFTNRGIVRLSGHDARAWPDSDHETGETRVEVFGKDDGLPSSECNTAATMIDRHGRVWAGTAEGLALLDPAHELPDTAPKKLSFEHVTFGGGKPSQRGLAGAELGYREANVVYEYALASYFRESETRYQTQLVGWERAPTPWTPDPKREYSNLPAGRYTFKVWGKDGSGNVTGPLADSFVVRAAPWRTPWAWGLYALTLGLLGWSVVRIRERALRAKNRELEASVAARTKELFEKNATLGENNEVLARNVEQLRLAEQKADAKAKELGRVNDQLVASQVQADRIFSALAEALPGTVLDGKYRLEVKVGAGGFGAVFRATHLALKRPVAVKVFRPTNGNDSADAVERFRREGETTSLLSHPNAVRVFDAGISSDGIAYMVMEMLQGHTLADELGEKKVLSIERAWQVLAPMADVLSEAHALGVLHRDVKPSNIFVHQGEQGEVVKVVDFGLAKLIGDDSGQENLTRSGRIVGTPAYMAPERLGSRASSTAADVYSVGVVLYEMLAGRTPFHQAGHNLVALLIAHLQETPPSLRALNPLVSEELERVVLSALAVTPEHRPTMDELATRFGAATGFTYVKRAQIPSTDSLRAPGLVSKGTLQSTEDAAKPGEERGKGG